jgi:hypothetical protein
VRDDHPAPWRPVVSQVNIINVHVIINTKRYSLLINAYIKDSVQGYGQGLRKFEAAVSVLCFSPLPTGWDLRRSKAVLVLSSTGRDLRRSKAVLVLLSTGRDLGRFKAVLVHSSTSQDLRRSKAVLVLLSTGRDLRRFKVTVSVPGRTH